MRIRVLQRPGVDCMDGIQLDHFEPGHQYEVSTRLGCLMLAERWAEPASTDEPALVAPVSERPAKAPRASPRNLVREFHPPYYDGPAALAVDRRSVRRSRRTRSGR